MFMANLLNMGNLLCSGTMMDVESAHSAKKSKLARSQRFTILTAVSLGPISDVR